MIRLRSNPTKRALKVLERCQQSWDKAKAEGREVTKSVSSCYRQREVKQSLLDETFRKCAYCESLISHVAWGDVEHLKPKSESDAGVLDYDNLTIACSICNNCKSNYWSLDEPILNPYSDDPDNHLCFLGTLVWTKKGSRLGRRTIDLLSLNRAALWERRKEHLDRISALADRFVDATREPLKDALRRELSLRCRTRLSIRHCAEPSSVLLTRSTGKTCDRLLEPADGP